MGMHTFLKVFNSAECLINSSKYFTIKKIGRNFITLWWMFSDRSTKLYLNLRFQYWWHWILSESSEIISQSFSWIGNLNGVNFILVLKILEYFCMCSSSSWSVINFISVLLPYQALNSSRLAFDLFRDFWRIFWTRSVKNSFSTRNCF